MCLSALLEMRQSSGLALLAAEAGTSGHLRGLLGLFRVQGLRGVLGVQDFRV